MGRHIGDSMYLPCCHIMSSDEDQPIVMDLCAGFDRQGRFMVCVDLYDYDEPEYNCSTAAVVDPVDSRRMARRNRVRHSRLPAFVGDCMSGWGEIVNPGFTQVRDCFKEITDCLIDEGCRFRLVRTYGKGGHQCC